MNILGGRISRIGSSATGLFMAGKKSPWGQTGGQSGGQGGDGPEDPGAGAPSGGPSSSGQSGGPRNPWVPPSSGDQGEAGPRRSASIEDIFKARARRGGGGGGGNGGGFPRLPQRPDGKSWLPLGIAFVLVAWLGASMFHFILSGLSIRSPLYGRPHGCPWSRR